MTKFFSAFDSLLRALSYRSGRSAQSAAPDDYVIGHHPVLSNAATLLRFIPIADAGNTAIRP